MLKAVKECMKNWLMVHERLYWYIVIGLAVLAFGVVTAVGCAKVYDANAAEVSVDDIILSADYQALMEYRDESLSYYSVVYFENDRGGHQLYLFQNENGEPLAHLTPQSINGYYDNAIRLGCPFNGKGWAAYVSAYEGIASVKSWNYENCTWGSHVSLYVIEGNMDIGLVTPYCATHPDGRNSATLYDVRSQRSTYSLDAPYVTFERLDVVNKIADGNTKVMFVNPYEDYTKSSSWEYFGTLRNMDSSKDLEYLLEVEFLAELPKDTYLEKLADELGVDVTWEYNMLRNTPDLVMMWNADNRAEKDVYEFTYTFPVVPDEHGCFSYELAFDTIETLIQYFNTDARERIQSYEEGHRAFLLSFLHIDCVSAVVKTTREDSIVYGKITTNQFDRGIYDVCIEVIPDVDINTATPEEIDKIIEDAAQDAHDKYLKDLEERLENLQNQINGVGSVEGAFANGLDGTDLWSGFQSLSSGLVSLAPSIASLSVLMGAVFGFLPVQIVGAMSFTLFALCVIALIKAIRG